MATEAMTGQPKQANPQSKKSTSMDILSAAAGGAGSLISSIGGLITRNSDRKFQQRLMREQNNFNAQEAEKSYQRQVEMFNMQNQYNSPANQRQLYQAAGFNPNLAMSGSAGTVSATGASSAPQASSGTAPDVRSQNPMAALGDFAGIVSSLSQAKLNESQANNLNADTDNKNANTKYQTMVNDIYEKYGERDFLSQLWNRDYLTAVYDSQQQLNDSKRNTETILQDLSKFDLNNIKPMQLANLVAEEQVKMSQFKLNMALEAKTKAEREKILKSIALDWAMTWASIKEIHSRIRYNNAQSSLIEPGGVLNNLYRWQGVTEEHKSNLTMHQDWREQLQYHWESMEYDRLGFDYLDAIERELNIQKREYNLDIDYYDQMDDSQFLRDLRGLIKLFDGPSVKNSGSKLLNKSFIKMLKYMPK